MRQNTKNGEGRRRAEGAMLNTGRIPECGSGASRQWYLVENPIYDLRLFKRAPSRDKCH